MENPKPITPQEAVSSRILHPDIIDIVNTLLRSKINRGFAKITQEEILSQFRGRHPDMDIDQFIKQGGLDIEETYEQNGWQVNYDKPGYNESYKAFFEFKAKKSG